MVARAKYPNSGVTVRRSPLNLLWSLEPDELDIEDEKSRERHKAVGALSQWQCSEDEGEKQ